MAPKFDWNQYQKQESAPKGAGGKFDWNQFQSEDQETPEPTMGQELLSGLVSAAETIDSYTGAPVRAGIGAAQDGRGFGGALSAAASQFGEDPKTAPTGKQIRKKAGIDLGDGTLDDVRVPGIDMSLGEIIRSHPAIKFNPVNRAVYGKLTSDVSPNDVADFGIEAGADITNVVPVGAIMKGVAKGGVKAASGAVNLASDAVAATGRGAAKVGKRVVQGAFGVPEESITRYLARHPQLRDKVGAREMMEELAGRLDEGLKPARAELQAAEEAVSRAKLSRTEDLAELQIKRQEAAEALRRAEDGALGEAASRVSSRVQQLNERSKTGSRAAQEVLSRTSERVDLTPVYHRIDDTIEKLKGYGTSDADSIIAKLHDYKAKLMTENWADIGTEAAKRRLQGLDQITSYSINPTAYDKALNSAFKGVRAELDDALKTQVPEYRKAMLPVARDTSLLRRSEDMALEGRAAGALRAASKPTGKEKADLLRELGETFGEDFLSTVDRRNLPEYTRLKGLLARVRSAKKGEGLKSAQSALDAKKGALGDSVELGAGRVAGITDKINANVRQAVPGAKETENLANAGKLAGVDMAEELKDLRTIASFEKGYNRGSANTNFWGAVIGGVMGSIFGPGGVIAGAAGGGAFGRMIIDNYGPKVGRIILDQAPLLQKVKPAQWIRTLDVSPAVKAKLAEDLIAYRRISQGTRGTAAASKQVGELGMKRVAEQEENDRAPADRTPSGGPDRWASTGLERLGIQDPAARAKLMRDPKGKKLLIEASDLKPGSPRLMKIKEQIKRVK